MTQEELEKRKQEITQRIQELQRGILPTAQRIVAFGAVGAIAGGVWAWKTKQKTMVKIGAVLGGIVCANLISTLLVSNEKTGNALEINQLQKELSDIERQLQKLNAWK